MERKCSGGLPKVGQKERSKGWAALECCEGPFQIALHALQDYLAGLSWDRAGPVKLETRGSRRDQGFEGMFDPCQQWKRHQAQLSGGLGSDFRSFLNYSTQSPLPRVSVLLWPWFLYIKLLKKWKFGVNIFYNLRNESLMFFSSGLCCCTDVGSHLEIPSASTGAQHVVQYSHAKRGVLRGWWSQGEVGGHWRATARMVFLIQRPGSSFLNTQ